MGRRILIVAVVLCAPGRAMTLPAAESRYTAFFVNGNRVHGAEIFEWHDVKSQPRLDQQKLLDPAQPLRWVQDNSLPPAELPDAYIEFIGGDRLPGRVTDYRHGTESPYRRLPPHLLVDPDAKVDWPDALRADGVPVLTRWLRRVVWEKRDDTRYRPGTLFYRDGRHVEFRAVRWSDGEVRLLLEQETRTVPFGQIAELHFPRVDFWNAWYEQLAVLNTAGSATLMQFETADGLRVTSSSDRFYPMSRGGGDPRQWHHALQPAWCLEPLWLPHRSVRVRRYFRANEVPLTALDPTRAVQKASLGGGWNWQFDRNVNGGPLAGGDGTFGWGLGVHAYSELEYELPSIAKTFRTQMGLDRAAGQGGCVRAAIYAGPVAGKPLFQTKQMIGSTIVVDSGILKLTAADAAPHRLTLVVDAAHADRPVGADPLEIRDIFDWGHPLVELDAAELQAEIERRAERLVPALQEWTLVDEEHVPLALANVWDPANPQSRMFRLQSMPREGFYTVSRQMDVSPEHQFLVLSVHRIERESTPSRLQFRIEGKPVGELEVPIRQSSGDADPLLLPIDQFRGRRIRIEVVHMGEGPRPLVEWGSIALVEHDPLLQKLFDDEPRFITDLGGGEALALFDTGDKYSGNGSVKITPGEKLNANMPDWNWIIRESPRVGEFRFVRFAWKKEGGKSMGLHLAREGRFADESETDQESFRYQTSREGTFDYGRSLIVGNSKATTWEVITRDLYADFGEFELTGLRLACPDGNSARFDQIYLARRAQDFDRLPGINKGPPPDPLANLSPAERENVLRATADPLKYGELLQEFASGFTASPSGGGMLLLNEYQQRTPVLRTHPAQGKRPCVLRAPIAVPAGKRTELRLAVAPHRKSDFELHVRANGEALYGLTVNEKTAQKNGWLETTIDLSKFAGKHMVLELVNQANGDGFEYAYWGRIELHSQ